MCEGASITLICAPESAAAARSWVAQTLRRMYGHLQPDLDGDVAVVVSELATNCIRADAHRFIVTVEAHRDTVTVATTDDAPGMPEVRHVTCDSPVGRGLTLVDALSSRWGVSPGAHTKTVWAKLPVDVGARPQFACTA